MKTTSKVLVGVAAAAAVLGVILLLRRRAAAAPVTAPALPEVAPQASYSGFVAATASGAKTNGVASTYGQITGAGANALCAAKTGGPNPLCDLAGSLTGKFNSVVAGTAGNVGSKLLGGAKSVFNKINPF